jgi:hypothetical protein
MRRKHKKVDQEEKLCLDSLKGNLATKKKQFIGKMFLSFAVVEMKAN